MKRIVFSLLALGVVTAASAQKATKWDKDEVTKYLLTKDYAKAKDYIDKVLQNPKEQDNKDALTYKAVIYSQLATDSATKASNPDGLNTANDVLLQLQQSTDTAGFNKLMRQDQGINAISAIYANDFNGGRDEFTRSSWDSSYNHFRNAAHWANYITQNGFSTNPDRNAIDTFTVLYTGFAAQNAAGTDSTGGYKNPAMADTAMSIYTQLADRQIHTADMAAMYQFMIQYYQGKKDNANTSKYLALAKQYYPNNASLWSQLETQSMLSGGGVDDIIKNYKDKDAAGGMTEDQYAQVGSSLANAEKQIKDTAKLHQVNAVAIDAFEKAFGLNQTNGLYAYNVAVLNYGLFNDLDDQFYANKGESADLKAKRAAIEKQQYPVADTAIYWFEKAYSVLSAKTNRDQQDNICGNNSAKSLTNLYQWEMDKKRGYDADAYKKYEALYNKYSALEEAMK